MITNVILEDEDKPYEDGPFKGIPKRFVEEQRNSNTFF
jgi:hypothetical protein